MMTLTGHAPGWKPVTVGPSVLALVILFSIGLIVAVQLLLNKSLSAGGILFARSADDFTAAQTFVYLYLPVVLALIYGLVWTWIDLNARRLEPYFAMSHRKGASAEASIFLDYTSTFIAFVPFKAARLK